MSISKVILGIGLLSISLAACSPAEPEVVTQPEEVSEAETTAPSEIGGETAEEADVTIEMSNFVYSVDSITAAPGETLTVKLMTVEGMHDFMIDELDVKTAVLNAGEEAMIDITIPADAQPGTEYVYYCSVGEHRANGMEGTIIVE